MFNFVNMLIRLDKSPYKFGGELSFSTSYLNEYFAAVKVTLKTQECI
jgi:hypothetical protein